MLNQRNRKAEQISKQLQEVQQRLQEAQAQLQQQELLFVKKERQFKVIIERQMKYLKTVASTNQTKR